LSTLLAPYADGIPLVADNNDRTQKFAVPATNQRVHNLAARAMQWWDGAQWVPIFNEVGVGVAPVFNIRDPAYGGIVDGTADDSAALQAAIATAQSVGGGIIWLGIGTLKVVTGAVVSTDGIKICGAGSGATVIKFAPTADGPCIRADGSGVSIWDFEVSGVEFQSTDTTHVKEMIRLVDCRRPLIEDVTSQDGLWNGVGSMGLRIYGRDWIKVRDSWFAADQPLKIEVNPNLASNALDYAMFECVQFAVQAGVSAYNVEIANGVTWSNNTWRDCDAARGLGFARWIDTTSPGASFENLFEGCRQEQSIAGATYSFDLESTVQQLQNTVFTRCIPGININGIKLRKAFYTRIDPWLQVAGDALNMDSSCRGLIAPNFVLAGSATTTGLSGVVGHVQMSNPDFGNIANQGDNDATLTALASSPVQRFTVALTANRAVTLSATNAHRGAKFRIVRSGLGDGTLDVGGLVTIPARTAAMVDTEHDGSGWRLTAYSVLGPTFSALIVNQGADDGAILQLKSSDVAHGVTGIAETDTYFQVKKRNAANGGALIQGLNADGSVNIDAILLQGIQTAVSTAKSNAAPAAVTIDGVKKSGAGGASLGANANIVSFSDNGTVRQIMDSDGDTHQDVGTAWTNFDDHDDVALLTELSVQVSRPDDPIRTHFRSFLEANRGRLETLKLVTFNEDGHHFVNWSRTTMLLVGAVRQLGTRLLGLEQVVAQARLKGAF
jgi:hypothetical protein